MFPMHTVMPLANTVLFFAFHCLWGFFGFGFLFCFVLFCFFAFLLLLLLFDLYFSTKKQKKEKISWRSFTLEENV